MKSKSYHFTLKKLTDTSKDVNGFIIDVVMIANYNFYFNFQEAKKLGYSDKQIASLLKSSETVIRARRKRLGVPGPWVKQVKGPTTDCF